MKADLVNRHEGRSAVLEYGTALERTGTHNLMGSGESLWVSYEIGAMQRMPTFYCSPPVNGETQRILRSGRVAVASYLLDSDEQHPANTWLYTCHDRSYDIEKLSKPARRDIRRAQRYLRFDSIDLDVLLNYGFPAYHETRRRVGLSDGTLDQFKKRFEFFGRNPFHHFVGAWENNVLAAFMSLIIVGNWVEITGSFSTDGQRDMCPTDGLVSYILNRYLVQNGFAVVSYGLSSVQENAVKAGLHSFKKKVGFDAQPVHRAFALHPLLRPIVNQFTLSLAHTALRLFPNGRVVRKAAGVLNSIIDPKNLSKSVPKDEIA